MRTYITGITGRLGRVICEVFKSRGDEMAVSFDNLNYLIFAHRYRGPELYAPEMQANVTDVIETIDHAKWSEGDRAIVIVSSICATDPAMEQSIGYNVSKAALNQVARYYAKLRKPARINTVSPATFTGDDPVVLPEQVAKVIAFLCSPESSGINGQDIRITG